METPNSMAAGFAGLGVLSSAVSGLGQYEAGQAQQGAYDYNAAVTLLNMRNKVQANEQQYSTLVGKQASAYARAGVDIASGSPLLIMAATAARGAQQGKQIEQSGTEEATLQRYYGRLSAWQGTMGGINTFLTGMSKSAMQYGQMTGVFSPKSPTNYPSPVNSSFAT